MTWALHVIRGLQYLANSLFSSLLRSIFFNLSQMVLNHQKLLVNHLNTQTKLKEHQRRYRSLFSRRRLAPPTPPPPSPPPSDDEPSMETFDPAAELEGDSDEPYIAEHVLIGAPRCIILMLRMDRSKRVPVPTPHLLAIILPAALMVASRWAMGLLPADRPVTVHLTIIW
ncbi:hypothetical protein PIB30_047397 [Stylosanthes scabra]|uniref:Uncharacterized protein n=1 Tax=Stylosanthes scabra TaxID=79078 RepID=A0ABU6QGP1_9FABA|nr:hypothetical protein [Stylosanthes scabra]